MKRIVEFSFLKSKLGDMSALSACLSIKVYKALKQNGFARMYRSTHAPLVTKKWHQWSR